MATGNNGSAAPGTIAPAKKKITRAEAYQLVRSHASNEFANVRSRQVHERAHFEQNYGSVTEVDESLIRDMKALMLRVSALAITNGKSKSRYDTETTPVKPLENVASTLSKAIAECELFLARRRATSLFEAPSQEQYLPPDAYNQRLDDPLTWVGPNARRSVEQMLSQYEIVDDKRQSVKSMTDLQRIVGSKCDHGMVSVDGIGGNEGVCETCGLEVGLVKINRGEEQWVDRDLLDDLGEITEFKGSEMAIQLPEGITLDSLAAMSAKDRRKKISEIVEALDADGDDEPAKPKRGGRKKATPA